LNGRTFSYSFSTNNNNNNSSLISIVPYGRNFRGTNIIINNNNNNNEKSAQRDANTARWL